jgi:hypothetical protein
MKIYIRIVIVSIILISCTQKDNSKAFTEKYTLEEYQEDFNQLVDLLLKKHPQPYALISKNSLTNLIDTQYAKINESTTVKDFLWVSSSVVSAIKCGHTDILGPNYPIIPQSHYLPVNASYIDSKLYVIDPRGNSDKIAIRDEIVSINGVRVETIYNELIPHISSDGLHKIRQHELINFNFYWLCPLFFNFPESYTFKVKHEDEIVEIDLQKATEYKHLKTVLDSCKDLLCFKINKENSTAIMTIRSFGFYKKKFSTFKSFVDDSFSQIEAEGIENLIIDLRNNGGGEPACASYLLEFLANKPYTYFHKDVKGYSDLKKVIHPNSKRFRNKPYILTNGFCFSSTGHFCSLIKEHDLATLVGTETGGTYTCNDYGKFYELDNTDLKVRIATGIAKTTATTLSNRQGIAPDHYVAPDINHFLNKSDTVLNYTLHLIGKD